MIYVRNVHPTRPCLVPTGNGSARLLLPGRHVLHAGRGGGAPVGQTVARRTDTRGGGHHCLGCRCARAPGRSPGHGSADPCRPSSASSIGIASATGLPAGCRRYRAVRDTTLADGQPIRTRASKHAGKRAHPWPISPPSSASPIKARSCTKRRASGWRPGDAAMAGQPSTSSGFGHSGPPVRPFHRSRPSLAVARRRSPTKRSASGCHPAGSRPRSCPGRDREGDAGSAS